MNTTTTTTNTTTAARFDLSALMRNAHAIRRAAAAEIGVNPSEIYWAACVRLAWRAAGNNAPFVRAADKARAEWAALTPSAQLDFCARCVNRAARDVIGYSTEDHYAQYWERPAFTFGMAALADFHNETFARVLAYLANIDRTNARRAANGQAPRTLAGIVYACAKAAVMAIYRAEVKHARADVREYVNADGDSVRAVELCAAPDCTEESALAAVAVRDFRATRDAIDNAILDARHADATTRETGAALGMSAMAVSKRAAKMRDAWTAYSAEA